MDTLEMFGWVFQCVWLFICDSQAVSVLFRWAGVYTGVSPNGAMTMSVFRYVSTWLMGSPQGGCGQVSGGYNHLPFFYGWMAGDSQQYVSRVPKLCSVLARDDGTGQFEDCCV